VDHRATLALSRVNEIIDILDPAVVIYISNGYVDRSPSLTRAGGRARMPVFALDPRPRCHCRYGRSGRRQLERLLGRHA
jgi:hypothetical protein